MKIKTTGKAILEGKRVVPCDDLIEWAKWLETHSAERVVAKTEIGNTKVSTVFLGMDHNFCGKTPLWFETMIFGGAHDDYQERYTTWAQAVVGHQRAVNLVKG